MNELKTKIVNLTGKPVTFLNKDDSILAIIKPEEYIAITHIKFNAAGNVDGLIPIEDIRYTNPIGIPDSRKNTIYLVSKECSMGVMDRDDVFFPNCPKYDENEMKDDEIKIPVQINGKT